MRERKLKEGANKDGEVEKGVVEESSKAAVVGQLQKVTDCKPLSRH
jgi:hypothetical protein